MIADQPEAQRVRQRVAAQVRRLRAVQHLTQEVVAGRAGLAVRHFRKIEAGEVNVTLDTLVKVAVALGVDVAELVQQPADRAEN